MVPGIVAVHSNMDSLTSTGARMNVPSAAISVNSFAILRKDRLFVDCNQRVSVLGSSDSAVILLGDLPPPGMGGDTSKTRGDSFE